MSDAYTECEERGIPRDAPDALPRLWATLTPGERREIFPHAVEEHYALDVLPGWVTAVGDDYDAGIRFWALTEPKRGEIRTWNGTSLLPFRLLHETMPDLERGYRIRYTTGAMAFAPMRELYEASHVIATAEEVAARAAAAPLPVPSAQSAARARVLAAEHVRQARKRLTPGVPSGGRPWRPGDEPRTKVLHEAADTLARLCAVYLGAREASPRNREEARAYALAFRLVEQSARRLAMRRLR